MGRWPACGRDLHQYCLGTRARPRSSLRPQSPTLRESRGDAAALTRQCRTARLVLWSTGDKVRSMHGKFPVRLWSEAKWFALGLLLMTPCARSNAATNAQEYFPRTVGMEYVMDIEIVNPGGRKSKGIVYRKFTERVERDGKTYLKLRTWTEGSAISTDYTKLTRKD